MDNINIELEEYENIKSYWVNFKEGVSHGEVSVTYGEITNKGAGSELFVYRLHPDEFSVNVDLSSYILREIADRLDELNNRRES